MIVFIHRHDVLTICKFLPFKFHIKIRGGEWSFKTSGSHKILVELQGSRSLVFFSGYESHSLVFIQSVSESKETKETNISNKHNWITTSVP